MNLIKTPKHVTCVASYSFILALVFSGTSAIAAQRIGYLSFENNLNDPQGFMTANNGQYVSFVTGKVGKAARSSHAGDDGSGTADFTLVTTTGNNSDYWPTTDELYIRFYYKFESTYENISHNVKWLWTYGSAYHNELACGGVSANSINLHWQLNGGGAGWTSGVTKYGSVSVTQGSWMLVEIYFELSSGSNHLNPDGTQWVKINGTYVINQTGVKTGMPSRMSVPAINATQNQPAGKGWWQIDEYEIWDGLPGVPVDNSPPAPPTGLAVR